MQVVIVGGGFGGIYAAKRLVKLLPNSHIILISSKNYFLFAPMLHEAATGGLSGESLKEPIREIFTSDNFRFIMAEVKWFSAAKKEVYTVSKMRIKYDFLIISTGSVTNFYDTQGAQERTLQLKDSNDAQCIRDKIITCVENCIQQQKQPSVAVVGGGPTGVELSLEIKELMNQMLLRTNIMPLVYLISSSIIPTFPNIQVDAQKAIRKHNINLIEAKVKQIKKNKVITDTQTINADVIIWTAGVKPNLITGCENYYSADEYLQSKYADIFVVGDCIVNNKYPRLAQVATAQGRHAALNIYLKHNNKPMRKFNYKLKGILISLGRKKGAGIILGVKINGFFAWWLMRTVYLFKLVGTANKFRTAYEWTLNLFVKRNTSQL